MGDVQMNVSNADQSYLAGKYGRQVISDLLRAVVDQAIIGIRLGWPDGRVTDVPLHARSFTLNVNDSIHGSLDLISGSVHICGMTEYQSTGRIVTHDPRVYWRRGGLPIEWIQEVIFGIAEPCDVYGTESRSLRYVSGSLSSVDLVLQAGTRWLLGKDLEISGWAGWRCVCKTIPADTVVTIVHEPVEAGGWFDISTDAGDHGSPSVSEFLASAPKPIQR